MFIWEITILFQLFDAPENALNPDPRSMGERLVFVELLNDMLQHDPTLLRFRCLRFSVSLLRMC